MPHRCFLSWLHLEIGHHVHEPLEPGSYLFAVWVYSSWRNAGFSSRYVLCVSSWCWWKGFLCEGELESCGRFSSCSHGASVRSLEKCVTSLAYLAASCSLFQFCFRRVFPCVPHKRGGGVAGSLDSQVTCHQFVSETHCSVVVLCGQTHRSSEPASKTTTRRLTQACPLFCASPFLMGPSWQHSSRTAQRRRGRRLRADWRHEQQSIA